MIKILSIEPYRKEATQIKVELSSGEIYVIGFLGQVPLKQNEAYTRILKDILAEYEEDTKSDLSTFLSYKMACMKLEEPFYVYKDTNKERERVGKKIREIRSSLKMEAKTLARLSQIDAANLSRIEQGKYSVGLDVLCKIATALNSRVDIVPTASKYDDNNSFSLTRKLWVIPTKGTHFNPICTVPACGYSLWPNTREVHFEIGDIVVFYSSDRKEYSEPHLLSGVDIYIERLGEDAMYADNWPQSKNGSYIRIDGHFLPDANVIKIHELIEQQIEGEPSEICEIKM